MITEKFVHQKVIDFGGQKLNLIFDPQFLGFLKTFLDATRDFFITPY